jgi:hypothetical protein
MIVISELATGRDMRKNETWGMSEDRDVDVWKAIRRIKCDLHAEA